LFEIRGKGGVHRLLCGDSTLAADVQRVMGGVKADAVLTDPPYGQNQPGVFNDEPDKLNHIINNAVKNLPVANTVICAFQSPHTFTTWLDAVRECGHSFERMLWLYKSAQMAFPWRGWILTSESILISAYGNPKWNDVHPYMHDCYYLPKVYGELNPDLGWHGSVKPLSVVSDIANRISLPNGIVFDPFGGSGTTLVACEQLGRQGRMIEIAPKYCAVILERMTGQGCEAVRVV
jgi:DNA modification methylase